MKNWLFIFMFILGGQHSQAVMTGEWIYIPVDYTFWMDAKELQTKNQFSDLMKFASAREAKYGIKTAKGAEAALFVAQTLKTQGFSALSFEIFKKIVTIHPGSMPALQSLLEINSMTDLANSDEEVLSRLISVANFTEYPKELESMISYYTALDNMRTGLTSWIRPAFEKIDPKSQWGHRIKYYQALEKIKNNDLESAKEIFKELVEDPTTGEKIKYKSSWNTARIFFEQKEYDKAEHIFYQLTFTGRDLGQSLLERAWIRYYKKDYSTALGMLELFKASYFNNSRNTEQDLLAMFIYRDLCHYPSVKQRLREFEGVYLSLINQIRNRKKVENNDLMLTQVLIHSPYKEKADVVQHLREERDRFTEQYGKKLEGILKVTFNESLAHEKTVKKTLQRLIPDLIEREEDRLLMGYDNLQLLDYASDLDELRIKQVVEKRSYASQKITNMEFDQLFWPAVGEFWWEEFKNYKVLIDDRCSTKKVEQ